MKLDTMIPCQVCHKPTDRIATHEKCLLAATALTTLDDSEAEYISEVVRDLADTCYLCGEPLRHFLSHADHVHPISSGGPHHWSNIGATHAECNLAKRDKVGITDVQQARLDMQHASLRRILARLDDGIWYQELVNLTGDAPEIEDLEFLREDIEDLLEDEPFAPPPHAIDTFFTMTKDPDCPRDTTSKQRLGMILDRWRAENVAAEAEWDAKYRDRDPRDVLREILDNMRP